MKSFRLLIFSYLLVLMSSTALASNLPVEHFSKNIKYRDAVISPNGKYLAVEMTSDEGRRMVAILNMKDMSMESYLPPHGKTEPFNPVWVNDKRYVVQLTERFGARDFLSANGELMAVDADGKNKKMLIQHQQWAANGYDKKPNKLHGYARIIHRLPKDKKHVLIEFTPWTGVAKVKNTQAYKLDINRGKVRKVTVAPSKAADFITSKSGEIKYSVGFDVADENDLVVHELNDGKWTKINDVVSDAAEFDVISATNTLGEIFVRESYENSTDKIFRLNTKTGEKKKIFQHPEVDPWLYTYGGDDNRLIAIHFEPDYPDLALVDDTHEYARWYPALFNAFGGKRVVITSSTKDNSKLVVHVTGADEPGQFHLFDTKTKKFRYLFNAKDWIKAEELAETKPFSIKSRDGKKLHGFITFPKGKEAKALPLVVMPHGGPHGPRDFWDYDDDVQFLASRGYSVLQINFRGSGGYGFGFEKMGYRKWGSDIQHDIIDATKWVIDEGYADAERVCIYGASFGGYSALMSSIVEPDLYKCSVGYVGVYDLNLMWKTGDIKKFLMGRNYLEDFIGDDEEELKRFSPLHQIHKLKAPVFLIHGGEDYRVDVKHYKKLVAALKKKKHPHETLLKANEGHGFYLEENRKELYERLEAFLDKHIGK